MITDISLEDTTCIFEKDSNDVLMSWVYPSIDETLKEVILNKSGLKNDKITSPFIYSKFKNTWIYIFTTSILKQKDEDSSIVIPDSLKKVSLYSICLVRNSFNPEKYASLAQIMSNIYLKTGDPTKLLECLLRLNLKGMFDVGALGKFVDSEFDLRRTYLATSIKDVINLFDQDIVLIWNAMLLKKRIIIYSDKLSSVLKVIRAFPLLVFHRQNWSLLRPFVTIDSVELKELVATGVYVAGFTDPSIKSREELYDLLVDLSSKEITIASHAKDQFVLNSTHKEVMKFLLSNAENEDVSDQAIIKGLQQYNIKMEDN